MIKLSVIIPAYNASRTMQRCMKSIFAVGLDESDFEIIAVDDCSTDNTLKSLQLYSKIYSNVKVLHQTVNKRQGAARNRAISEAEGEYIAFVDADDEVCGGLKDALANVLLTRADMQYCSVESVGGDGRSINHYSIGLSDDALITGKTFLNDFYKTQLCAYPWAWLYRKRFLTSLNIPFIEGRIAEDMDWIELHLMNAERVGCFSKVIYRYYVQNNNSSTHTMNWKYEADRMHMVMRRLKLMESVKEELPHYAKQVWEDSYHLQMMRWRLRRLSKYSPTFYWRLMSNTDIKDDVLPYLRKYDWSKTAELCQNHKYLTLALLCIIYPVSTIGRWMTSIIKKS